MLLGLSGILALFVFYLSAGISGRVTDKKPFDYITMYVGGSIECFNLWMQEPDEVRVVHGEYTFSRTISDLNEIKYSKRLSEGETNEVETNFEHIPKIYPVSIRIKNNMYKSVKSDVII